MKNVTITLDKEVATWARIRAAELGTSVPRLVGGMLKEKMPEEETYKTSMQQYLSQCPNLIKEPGTKYPTAVRNFMSVRIFVDTNILVYS